MRAEDRAGDSGQQPPVVLRPLLCSAAVAAQGGFPREIRVLHRAGDQGIVQPRVLQRSRADPRRPVRRQGKRAGPGHRPARAGRRTAARHLPGGNQDPGRPPVPRQDRCRPPRARSASPCRPVRDDRRLRVPAARKAHAAIQGAAWGKVRQGARLLQVLRHGERQARAQGRHRRDHLRDHEAVWAGVRRRVRRSAQGKEARREARAEARRRGQGTADHGLCRRGLCRPRAGLAGPGFAGCGFAGCGLVGRGLAGCGFVRLRALQCRWRLVSRSTAPHPVQTPGQSTPRQPMRRLRLPIDPRPPKGSRRRPRTRQPLAGSGRATFGRPRSQTGSLQSSRQSHRSLTQPESPPPVGHAMVYSMVH